MSIETAEPAKKESFLGSKKGKMIIGALVLALAGGGFTAYRMMSPSDPAAAGQHKQEAKKHEEKKEGEKGEGKEGERDDIYSLDPIVVNLVDVGDMHYLKIKIELELKTPELRGEVKEHLMAVKDDVISLLSSKGVGELQAPDGKTRLKADLIARLNTLLPSKGISKIYFTDFVLQ